MDKKHDDTQKRTLSHDVFFCPACESLEEHRNKNCPEPYLTVSTSDIVDVNTHDNDSNKRPCYRCDDCNLSFTNSHNLEDHRAKNCRKKQTMLASEVASYQSCMEGLKAAIEDEKLIIDSLKKARSETKDAVTHYKAVKTRKERAEKGYMDAVVRKMNLCTIVSAEEELIVSDIAARASNELKNAQKEEALALIGINRALHKLKKANDMATCSSNKVQFSFGEVFKSLQKKSAILHPQVMHKKLMHVRTILNQSCFTLIELQQGAAELEASISGMIGIGPKKEDLGRVENVGLITSPENESGSDSSIDPPQAKVLVDEARLNEKDMTAENIDFIKPSTSGAQ